jgi:hypothetical protein
LVAPVFVGLGAGAGVAGAFGAGAGAVVVVVVVVGALVVGALAVPAANASDEPLKAIAAIVVAVMILRIANLSIVLHHSNIG